MLIRSKPRPTRTQKAQRKAIRKAAALPAGQQSLAAVYALGIRDGLRIAADIRAKIQQSGEEAT